MRLATLVAAPRAFIEPVSDPRDGPYLTAVGVSAQLEVDAGTLCLFQVVWLVVENDGELLKERSGFLHQLA